MKARERNFNIEITNVTEYLACIAIVGPLTRQVIQQLTKEDMSDAKFPTGSSKLIRLASVPVIACHDTTTGR